MGARMGGGAAYMRSPSLGNQTIFIFYMGVCCFFLHVGGLFLLMGGHFGLDPLITISAGAHVYYYQIFHTRWNLCIVDDKVI